VLRFKGEAREDVVDSAPRAVSAGRSSRQRKPRQDGERSRTAIVTAAAQLATLEGLDGLSLGRLADYVGMSKSGLYAHFRSKEELQLAAIDAALDLFDTEVVKPTLRAGAPLERLRALCESYIAYVDRLVFPGGCFFASANAEFDTRQGLIRDRLMQFNTDWMRSLTTPAEAAQKGGALSAHEEPQQLAFELNALLNYANSSYLLTRDSRVLDRARRAVAARLDAAIAH
jgi:AcrR family transcriptional regulator